jgi:hypothetical protein
MRIVLPSNVSKRYFPNNTLCEYTVKLPEPIDLSKGQWEIGLSEIQFFKSWYNVTEAILIVQTQDKTINIAIPDGYYQTNESLVKHLNEALRCYCAKAIHNNITFEYHEITRKCGVKIQSNEELTSQFKSMEFNDTLKKILGIENFDVETNPECLQESVNEDDTNVFLITGMHPIRLRTIFNLMIYSDVVSDSVVGDIKAPLLRVVAVKEGHWKYQSTTIDKIQYMPVSKKELRTVSVYIYTDYGQLVPFTDGRTTVTVDLRRVNPINWY